MAYFAVTYDLVKDKDYKLIIDELERLGAAKIALSVWFVELENSASEIRDYLSDFVDKDDKLIVIPFEKKPYFTRGFTTGANWINNRRFI